MYLLQLWCEYTMDTVKAEETSYRIQYPDPTTTKNASDFSPYRPCSTKHHQHNLCVKHLAMLQWMHKNYLYCKYTPLSVARYQFI